MEIKDLVKKFFLIRDEKKKAYSDYLTAKETEWEYIKLLRKHLEDKEYQVLKMRHRDGLTLEAIGRALGTTRERARNIYEGMIEKLQDEANN